MTEKKWGKIVEYSPSMAVDIAEMFNDFNELWPGGFQGGIPFDDQRVKDMLENNSAIANLIALDTEGNPVGYCGLYPHWRDADAAYLGILGVVPRVVGKKFGKRLLLEALQIATEKGIKRVDLSTWPGNLKAVPLYKKVGLCWVPGTSVHMQDYIPGLLQIPLASKWFSRHPDWYTTFKREIAQAPDEYVVDGMEVYVYTFEAGKDRLSVEVDRYGWGFCSIEYALDGESLSVKTRLRSHEIFIGMTNALTLVITNNTGVDMPLSLLVEPFKGLKWVEPFPSSITLKNGETAEITREFVVDSSAPLFKSNDRASEVIKSKITFQDESIELETGGKIHPAITVTRDYPFKIAPPHRKTEVYLDVINNTKEEITGKIDISIEGAPKSHQTLDIVLPPQKVAGTKVMVDVGSAPVVLHATPSIHIDEGFSMPDYTCTVIPDCKDMAVVAPETEPFYLVTDFIIIYVELERGRIGITERFQEMSRKYIDFDVGPPFGFSLDRTRLFDYQVTKDDSYTTVTLTGMSIHVPGTQIKKHVKVKSGTHEIEFWTTLKNCNTQSPIHVGGKVTLGGEEGISINPYSDLRRVFTPLKHRIVESDPSTRMMSMNMIPQDPEDWKESWTIAQRLNKDDFTAWMWEPEHIEKITLVSGVLRSLESATEVIPPGESYEPVHLWYTFSHSSLQDIRVRWNQLIGHNEISAQDYFETESSPLFTVHLDDPLVEKGKISTKSVKMCCYTYYPLPGELSLVLPLGWKGQFLTGKGRCTTVAMPECAFTPAFVDVELSVPSNAQPVELVNLHFSGEFELDFDIPLLVTGSSPVAVHTNAIEGHPVLEMENGALKFSVITEVGGNLIRLQDTKQRSFLGDNYPHIKPKFFHDYNIGGIQPVITRSRQDNPFREPEKTTACPVEEGPWKGVKVSWTVQNQKFLRGQKFALTYVTLPELPVIRILLEHENPTDRLVRWTAVLTSQIEFQGSLEDTVLTAPGGIQTWVRNRVKKQFVSLVDLDNPWVKASKKDQSLIICAPEGTAGGTLILDFTEMILGLMITSKETGPREKTRVEFVVAVNQSEEKVSQLRKALGTQKD